MRFFYELFDVINDDPVFLHCKRLQLLLNESLLFSLNSKNGVAMKVKKLEYLDKVLFNLDK